MNSCKKRKLPFKSTLLNSHVTNKYLANTINNFQFIRHLIKVQIGECPFSIDKGKPPANKRT